MLHEMHSKVISYYLWHEYSDFLVFNLGYVRELIFYVENFHIHVRG